MESSSSGGVPLNVGESSAPPPSLCYCMLNGIPSTFHTSDLRNFFSEYIEAEKFDLFHFRHRPQIVNIVDSSINSRLCTTQTGDSESLEKNSKSDAPPTSSTPSTKSFCCVIRFTEDETRDLFIKRYHRKVWMDKDGNDLPTRCIITKVNLGGDDLKRFSGKELNPPKFMPRGNVGTPNSYFLGLIRECRLPPSLIKKLGLEFPRARVYKRYSKVPFDYKTRLLAPSGEEEEEEIKTGKGHSISDVYIPKNTSRSAASGSQEEERKQNSDEESNADDDDDRCEEWERHEALHDHRTTHGDVTSESKERLYETEIELQWEKGGPGIVWYTDAQFWDQQRGSFDERTADDWDVDMQGYYEPGGGDKDAQDLMNMRRSERVQAGLESISVIKKARTTSGGGKSGKVAVQVNQKGSGIGEFEKHTRGIGRKVLEKFGWKDGDGLGKTIVGIPDALEGEGQAPADKRGFGYYGEKLELGNPSRRKRDFKDYDLEAADRIVIGTVYDKPEDLDVPEPLKRRNAPTFVKRYGNFSKATNVNAHAQTNTK